MAEKEEQQQKGVRIQIDDRGVNVESSDYWLITGTPEEVLLRFGNTKHNVGGPIKITDKVSISYYTAKRLLAAMIQTIKKYEEALGSIDVEAEKS